MHRPLSSSRVWTTAAVLAALLGTTLPSAAQSPATATLITGKIDLLEVDHPNDRWSSGQIVVAGQLIVLPRNLLIDLPANRLSLQQLFTDAPPAALAKGVSGLAQLDGPEFPPAYATVLGNRNSFGNVIAGELFIAKGIEVVQGMVTLVNTTDGYLRVDGIVGDDTTGVMVRINDPESRFTIQQGKGCDGGPNCTSDARFGVDPDNYTITFTTGYPAGIPSTIPAGLRPGFRSGDDPNAKSDAAGVGDPFCPSTNRGVLTVPDSTRFAPIQVGDTINAEGNFEIVNGERFLSAHTLTVLDALLTQDNPTQPDYMIFDEVEWDVPAFNNQRARLLMIGFTTLNDSQLDVFSLNVDPRANQNHEVPLGSTVGNPGTINQGIIPGRGGIFKIGYDVDFVAIQAAGRSPCQNLINAGFGSLCPRGGTLAENVAVLCPITREIQGRTRHSRVLAPGVITRDINGERATNGQYLTPVGIGHPEFGEIDLGALQTPFSFDGVNWNLDRRLSPGGCDGDCESSAQPLDPFPWSGMDPVAFMPAEVKKEPFQYFPFQNTNVVAWPPVAPGGIEIAPIPHPGGPNDPTSRPQAEFGASLSRGVAPLTVSFSDQSIGVINAHLWDFGDGTFSTEPSPTHIFAEPGIFSVTLTVQTLGGQDEKTKNDLVRVDPTESATAPQASFKSDRTAGNIPLTVNFTNLTTGDASSYLWRFGDGATSTARNPSHEYTSAGRFTVSLAASGPGGSSLETKLDFITANSQGNVDIDFTAQPANGTAPLEVRFRGRVVSGQGSLVTGTWDFGDGTTAPANGQDLRHTYLNPGVYTVTLTGKKGSATDIEQKVDLIHVTAPTVRQAPVKVPR